MCRHKEQEQYFLFTFSVDFSVFHTFSQTISFIIHFVLGDGISGIDLSCCYCSHMSGTLRVCVCGGGGGGGGGEGACPTSPSILSQIMHSSCMSLSLSQEFNL